ncbi:hypothetical protein O7632_20450 [Solwaraspora sp. WMMD406]|uniref:hypothetical protein n=1 Tax=Solwaraspora sp. WMMD406 TaxID=3016095 RepID=UPI0024162C91|nr:hypothetical protein [Solwaraspora sp. WMMD406]MDG4766452.1 hypothetical protein [Solwaraspora sp. WMMD406]
MCLFRGEPIGREPRLVRSLAANGVERPDPRGNTPYRWETGSHGGARPATAGAGGAGGGGGNDGHWPPAPRTGGHRPEYPLDGLLFCAACERALTGMEMLGGRAYGSPCGCRLTVLNAQRLEQLVLHALATREPGALVQIEQAVDPGQLMRRYLAEVRIGGTIDDLDLVWLV